MVEKPQRNKVVLENGKTKGLGYLKDLNSHKDFSIDNPKVQPILNKLKLGAPSPKIPDSFDFTKKMSQIRDQGELGSCTAFALSALVEYFELMSYHKYTQISTRFTYKASRDLMRLKGDTGAYIRSAMGSLALFGTPPEEYWEYDIQEFDTDPPAFCYAFAQNYQSTRYVRIDHTNVTGDFTVSLMKKFLAREIPVMFGFTVFDSIDQASNFGHIPYPSPNENILGGHAITTCGYDDKLEIENKQTKQTTTGAFIIRNSWGKEWGKDGYGCLPYEYFNQKLADDCWVIVSQEWIDHLVFQ